MDDGVGKWQSPRGTPRELLEGSDYAGTELVGVAAIRGVGHGIITTGGRTPVVVAARVRAEVAVAAVTIVPVTMRPVMMIVAPVEIAKTGLIAVGQVIVLERADVVIALVSVAIAAEIRPGPARRAIRSISGTVGLNRTDQHQTEQSNQRTHE